MLTALIIVYIWGIIHGLMLGDIWRRARAVRARKSHGDGLGLIGRDPDGDCVCAFIYRRHARSDVRDKLGFMMDCYPEDLWEWSLSVEEVVK